MITVLVWGSRRRQGFLTVLITGFLVVVQIFCGRSCHQAYWRDHIIIHSLIVTQDHHKHQKVYSSDLCYFIHLCTYPSPYIQDIIPIYSP
jgi:hypothetical protein